MNKRIIFAAISMIALGAAICMVELGGVPLFKIYYVRDDGGGELLLGSDEAFLFEGVVRRGFDLNYVKYAWVLLEDYLHAVPKPTVEQSSLTVIRVTPSGIERHFIDESTDPLCKDPNLYTPFQKHIYANSGGVLCEWTGSDFRPAVAGGPPELHGVNGLAPEVDSEVNGWTKRGVGGGADYNFTIANNQFVLSEKNEGPGRSGCVNVSVYVRRYGQAAEEVLHLDQCPRRVGKAEYERAFLPRPRN
jgi:hypothetical protein